MVEIVETLYMPKVLPTLRGKVKANTTLYPRFAREFFIYIAYNISNVHTRRLFLTFIIYNFYVTYGRPSSNALISPIFYLTILHDFKYSICPQFSLE